MIGREREKTASGPAKPIHMKVYKPYILLVGMEIESAGEIRERESDR